MRDATLPALRLGTVLEGAYVVGSPIASGTTSVVHRGEQVGTGHPVAIKLVWGDAAEASLARAGMMSGLSHPHLAVNLASGRTEGGAFHVLPWCDGGSLAEAIERTGRRATAPAEAIACLRPIVEAAAVLHANGLVHNDIKPSNVMLTSAGPMLIDFGSLGSVTTRQANERSSAPRELTPAYAAPEQALGARSGPPADVYAIGMMFVELLCGRPPKSVAIEQASREIASRAGALFPVLERCLRTAPGERWPDAGALARALEAPDLPSTTAAVLVKPAQRAVRRKERPSSSLRTLVVIASLLLAMGTATAMVGLYLFSRGEDASAAPPAEPSAEPSRGLGALTPESLKLRLSRAGDDAANETTFSARDAYASYTITTHSGRIVTLFTGVRIDHAMLYQGFGAHASEGDRLVTVWSRDPDDARRWLAIVLEADAPSTIPALPPPSLSKGESPSYDLAELERRLRAARFHITSKNTVAHPPVRTADGQRSIGEDVSVVVVERTGCAPLSIEWHRHITEPSAIPTLMKRDVRTASATGKDAFLVVTQSREADGGPWCGDEVLDLLTR